jgi:hypothetical protein
LIESTGRPFRWAAFRIEPVVDAVGLLFVVAHVRVDPGDAEIRVATDHAEARNGALAGHRDAEPVRERPFDDVTRHRVLLSLGRILRPTPYSHPGQAGHIGRIPHFGGIPESYP